VIKDSKFEGHRVLHIHSQPPALSESAPRRTPIAELLASLPLETDWCGDVYRGLARLLRPSANRPQAVIVCLDGLGNPEFEFFAIVSRLCRDLKIYAYAAASAKSRIARAVELGATGPATRESLEELTRGSPVPMSAENHEEDSEPLTAKSVSPSSFAAASESTGVDREDAQKPARVPWLRYGDRPARVAPPRHGHAPNAPCPPSSCEPLLTDEELRALMNDDIDAKTSEDSGSTLPDDNQQIRGVS